MGSCSGTMNQRDGGGSDDEIAKLTPAAHEAAQLKLSEVKDEAATSTVTEDYKIRVIEWLTDKKQWPDMCIKQSIYWVTV